MTSDTSDLPQKNNKRPWYAILSVFKDSIVGYFSEGAFFHGAALAYYTLFAFISLNRNLHCWALSFYYVPVGGNRSFLLSIRNTSSIFKDAKIEFRKPPGFL